MYAAEGHCKRSDQEWERTAWLGRLIVSPHVKHPPSIDALLGRQKKIAKKNKAEQNEELAWLAERFKGKG